MNINLTLGVIVFLLWSTLSSWYYVCKIKGLCLESTTDVETPIVDNAPEQPISEKPKKEEPKLKPISISEDQIYFVKNSTNFLDTAYVEGMTAQIKSEIEGREVNISIVGYTCNLGKEEYNQRLGLMRATALQAFFESRNLDQSKFEITSKGESEALGKTEAQRKKDRKVTITIKSTDQ